ncbi:MAG: hypothetical protein ABIA67_03220 [Candidatus Margulisiibacteriota bacterium]
MRVAKQFLFVFLILFLSSSILHAADIDFPYGSFRFKVPPSEDPFPGLGGYYSTLSNGMKCALWNPASLGKLKLSEASFSTISALETFDYQKSFNLEETSGNLEFDTGSVGAGGQYGIFYRYPGDIGSGIITKEVEVLSHATYATESTGQNFSTALKVNDWITVGFSSKSPFEVDQTIAGAFPVTARAFTSFVGQKIGDMQVGADGKLSYTYTNGVVVTYESSAAVWNEFLSQEATIPVIAYSELRNNINLSSPFMGTVSSKIGNFYFGLNMIPVSGTADINNDVRALVDSDTQSSYLYTPNFDPNSQADIADWATKEARYGTSAGYQRKEIRLPAGDVIGTAKYRGFYAASTTRFDIGGIYDVTNWLTVGFAMENFTGAALNLKGTGISSFMNYRRFNTEEAATFDQIMQPGGKDEVDLISDRWTTTFEVNSTKLYLEPEKTYTLPRRLRYGFALKRPFLIVVDFESNQNPIKYVTEENGQPNEIVISNINFIRIGMETRLLALPLWLKSGVTLMPKPSITGLPAETQESVDNLYNNLAKYYIPGLPVRFDLGADLNAWETIVGSSFGISAQSLLNFLQVDPTDADPSKMAYINTYVIKEAWRVDYNLKLDPFASASAYSNRTVPAGQEKSPELSDLRYVQTLGVTYKF